MAKTKKIIINDKVMTLEENFDCDKLNYIIENFEQIKKKLRPASLKRMLNAKKKLTEYLNNSRFGKIKVHYKQNKSYGRYYAIKSLSLQNIPREIRHTIAKEYYLDIDIKNAHPEILLKLCKEDNVDCEDLEEYITNREKLLADLKIDRETGKKIYLSLLNGGESDYKKLETKTTHLKLFKKEMKNIHNHFADKYPIQYKKHVKEKKEKKEDFNLKASFMNKILCNEENKILMKMYEYFGSPNNCVLCFDGLMLKKGKYNLERCQKYISDTLGYNLKIVVKEMNQDLKIPDKLKKYKYERYEFYNDYKKFVAKDVIMDHLMEWLNNAIVLIDNGGCEFFYTKERYIHYYSDNTKEEIITWNMKKISDVYDNLKVIVNVINPFYGLNLREGPQNNYYLFRYLSNTTQKFKGFIQDCKEKRMLKNYNRVDYLPYLNEKPEMEDTFNLFNGFPLQKKNINFGDMKFENTKIYNHLKKYFFSDKGELNHFLDFVADMIQDPGTLKGTGHLFYSTLGCGKGLICKLICKLLGSDNAIIIVDTQRYFEKFNNLYKNKILKIFEEIKEKGSAFHNHNRIKGEMTNDLEIIEKKGMDQVQCRNFARIIMNSNNENATYVEAGVRRLSYHKLSGEKANNYEYFKPLWEELKNEKFLKCAFEYFKNRKYDVKNVLNSYETEYRQDQKKVNLPKGIKFMINYIEENFDTLIDEKIKIQATILRDEYKEYCRNEGYQYKYSGFKTQIKQIGIEDPIRSAIAINNKIKRVKCYFINPHKLEKKIKKHLKDDKFKFDFGNIPVEKKMNDIFENTKSKFW